MGTTEAKRRPERKNKRNWRKNVNTKDIDDFLDDKRLEERLGLKEKKNEELFVLDFDANPTSTATSKKGRTREEKKKWACEPSYYKKALIPQSAVNDPIKRNRVRTKEERAGDRKPKPGILRRLEEGIQQRKTHFKNLKHQRKIDKNITFYRDLWGKEESKVDTTWYNEETAKVARIATGEFKVKPPKRKKLPEIPAIEAPHPGISYNPSLADHKNLLSQVAEREMAEMKTEAHLKRVLTVPKITEAQRENMWMAERVSGLTENKDEEEEEEETAVEGKTSEEKKNPPVSREKKKTLKQRRRFKELAAEARQRFLAKVEKKKLSDIFKLRKLGESIEKTEARNNVVAEKRRKQIDEKRRLGVERLARMKYEEPHQEIVSVSELGGSLRKTQNRPAAILRDRFASLQRRNVLAPTKMIAKMRKKNVKRFVKTTHRLEDAEAEHEKLHGKGSGNKGKWNVKTIGKVKVYE